MPTAISIYLQRCCEWIREEADLRLMNSGIGDTVISNIINSSEIKVSGNIGKLSYGDKAVYVEFGVGIVGSQDPHPQAVQSGYKYDVDSIRKKRDRSWIFSVSSEAEIDIRQENILKRTENTVRTLGNQASLFLYQSALDFKSTGAYKELWR